MLTSGVPMLNFNFSECEEVVHDDVIHAIPKGDSDKHGVSGCKCGTKEIRFGDTLFAVVHRAWDKRDLVEDLFFTESYESAHEIRKEYMATIKSLLQRGKVTTKQYWEKLLVFEDACQTIYQVN
jgi:hypothetical protein